MAGNSNPDMSWRRIFAALVLTLAILATAPAHAKPARDYEVPAGTLADALLVFAQQADISISATDPGLREQRTRGLKGRYSVKQGLRRLLRKSGYAFTMVDRNSVRIVRKRSASRQARRKPPPPVPATRPLPTPSDPVRPEIVVRATKQGSLLTSYPASVSVVELSPEDAVRFGARGSELLLEQVPNMASTNLGSGRNKIFIRGVADSSFSGVSQATISQYLGDSRLIYSAPDPDLALYDIRRVEVLEGPQGTLYGAGTLGGIIRLVPNDPDLSSYDARLSAALHSVRHGDEGGEATAMLNLPILRDKVGLRVLGYHNVTPGYIDDRLRGIADVNRKLVTGIRAALRIKPARGWTFDFGVLGQLNRSRDAQYTERGQPFLTRRSATDQHYDNDFRMAWARLIKQWDGVELVSATNYTDHSVDSNFDATLQPGTSPTILYNEDMTVKLLAHETRLSGKIGGAGHWVVGASLVKNVNVSEREIGPPEDLETIALIRNRTIDKAIFGEATFAIARRVSLTLGGRYSLVRQTVELLEQDLPDDFEPKRSQKQFLPTAAISWRPRGGWLAYVRFQKGFRPGGLQIAGGLDEPTALRFEEDGIRTVELGLRFGTRPGSRLSGDISFSHSRWNDIQADLVDLQGFPITANIGSGRVRNLSANITWQPWPWLSLDASGFINNSNLDRPAPQFLADEDRDLPNIADLGWKLSAVARKDLGRATLSGQSTLRYVGRSSLAIGEPFNLSQGGFYELSMGTRIGFGPWGLSIDVQNLLDADGNRFSYGNPFSVAGGQQTTPLRPRTVRIGIDAHF
ncbi:MAG: TonB-dependent receptor [Novosphingobium sp.]|nr:TonB-dependent receptor [Novosphingobium sp.]